MADIETLLKQWVAEACKYPPGSRQRQDYLTKVIRAASKKLWQERTPYYEDAVQKTWVYFCRNVCEANSAKDKYDPTKSNVTTWLNNHLRFRLKDAKGQQSLEEQRRVSPYRRGSRTGERGELVDPIDLIPAPEPVPDVLTEVRAWIAADPTGELRAKHIKGHPEVTCQVLLLRRLPPETSWKDLASEFGIPIPSLASFYQRQCLPKLRKFGESEGYV